MNPKRILIVEDEALVAMLMAKNLKSLGYEICNTVASGEEAIEITREENPDAIIMDRRLAGKLDGFDATRQIRSFSTVPVVFVTGYVDKHMQEDMHLVQPAVYLVKPTPVREIKAALEDMLAISHKIQ